MPRTTSLVITAVLLLLEHVAGESCPGPNGPDLPAALNNIGDLVILSKAGITNTGTGTIINGDIGNPGPGSMTGFGQLTMDISGEFATSAQIDGKVYAANYAALTVDTSDDSKVPDAISEMDVAYTDASSRSASTSGSCPHVFEEFGGGLLVEGLVLKPGLYKWTTGVTISGDITLSGSATDTWIFHSAGAFTMGADKKMKIILDGAHAKNIVWVMAGAMTVGAGAHADGIFIVNAAATFGLGASLTGRVLAQAAVTLHNSVITQPA
jgi:hypothetical protein